MRRLRFLPKRFLGNHDLSVKYKEAISTYIKEGYARKMTKEETIITSEKTWYLPHHPVFHPQKPGKVQLVVVAAAKCKGKSLNKELFNGSDLLHSLVGVLLQFRNNKIALVGDVEAMFHQVRVKPSEREMLFGYSGQIHLLKNQRKSILTKCWPIYLEQQIHRAVQTLQ